jgi:hypothetical protein
MAPAPVKVTTFTPPRADLALVMDLLRELLDGQARILAALERQRRPSAVDDARFVAAIAASAKGCAFSSAELLQHVRVDADLREVLGGRTSRQIGKQLRALADRPVGGFVVRRIGRDGDGTIWAVQAADLHADTGAAGDRGV